MKALKNFFKLLFLLLVTPSFSQSYDLGKVTVQELEEKAHPLNKDAEAAILFSKGESYFEYNDNDGFVLVTEVEMKIKIYSKEGYTWANKTVQYYIDGTPNESLDFSKAYTYNLENGKIEKTKLKTEGEFFEKVNNYWARKKITMPNVKEGSVIEYKYKIRSPFLSSIPEWYFQSSIPVNYSVLTTRIPEYYTYQPNLKGYITPEISNSTRDVTVNSQTKEREASRTNFYDSSFKYKQTTTVYETKNLTAMKDEVFVNNIKNYISSVSFELKQRQYPNVPIEYFSKTWDDVVKTIYDYESFGNELRKTGYFEDDLTKLLDAGDPQNIKIEKIFSFVKSKMSWDDFTGYTCNDGVKTAYKNNKGNVAEINLMLTAMLRYAGFNANPVILSTRDNGISIFPNRTSFNYVIAAVEMDNGLILLDATEKNATPNILPIRALNWEGRLIRKDGTSIAVSLAPTTLSKDAKQIMVKLDENGSLTGKARIQNTDYNAYNLRNNYIGFSKESYIEKMEKRYDNLQIEEYTITNDKELSKPTQEEISFTYDGLVEKIGNKLYFSPMLFFQLSENPFKLEKREYPIDFVFPQQDKYSFSITIPEGYQVESVPEPMAIAIDNNMIMFTYNIQVKENVVQLISSLDIKQSIISPVYYDSLKEFFKNVVEKQNEKVVLIKS